MKYLIAESIGLKPHLETAGEIAISLIKKSKAKVDFCWLGYDLPSNDMDLPIVSKVLGASMIKRVDIFKKILADKNINVLGEPNLEANLSSQIQLWAHNFYGSLDNLRNYRYKKANLGLGVASSLISYYGDPNIEPLKKINFTRNLLVASAIVFERTIKVINLIKPDRIYTFNGRFSIAKPITEAARLSGIQIFRHERGSNYLKYEIYEHSIHNFNYIEKRIHNLWKSTSDKNKFYEGRKFFLKKRAGENLNWHSFTSNQIKNLLPQLVKGKKIITYFSSSEDEYQAFIDQYMSGFWSNQLLAVRSLIQIANKNKYIHVVIRMHPNLKNKSGAQNLEWLNLHNKNVTVIKPESLVDSYALMDRSDVIVTYGSTIGIEAAYWKKPSILIGPSWYQNSNSIFKANHYKDLEFYINNIDMLLVPLKNDVLRYGYYQFTYGIPYVFYKPKNLFEGSFFGAKLDANSKLIKGLKRVKLDSIYIYFKTLFKYKFKMNFDKFFKNKNEKNYY